MSPNRGEQNFNTETIRNPQINAQVFMMEIEANGNTNLLENSANQDSLLPKINPTFVSDVVAYTTQQLKPLKAENLPHSFLSAEVNFSGITARTLLLILPSENDSNSFLVLSLSASSQIIQKFFDNSGQTEEEEMSKRNRVIQKLFIDTRTPDELESFNGFNGIIKHPQNNEFFLNLYQSGVPFHHFES